MRILPSLVIAAALLATGGILLHIATSAWSEHVGAGCIIIGFSAAIVTAFGAWTAEDQN